MLIRRNKIRLGLNCVMINFCFCSSPMHKKNEMCDGREKTFPRWYVFAVWFQKKTSSNLFFTILFEDDRAGYVQEEALVSTVRSCCHASGHIFLQWSQKSGASDMRVLLLPYQSLDTVSRVFPLPCLKLIRCVHCSVTIRCRP